MQPQESVCSQRTDDNDTTAHTLAAEFIKNMESLILAAKDNLLTPKIMQVHFANRNRNGEPEYEVGDKVLLVMAHQWWEYMQAKDGRVAKFMPRYDGPYEITPSPMAQAIIYNYLLHLKYIQSFHMSQLHPFLPNGNDSYPG